MRTKTENGDAIARTMDWLDQLRAEGSVEPGAGPGSEPAAAGGPAADISAAPVGEPVPPVGEPVPPVGEPQNVPGVPPLSAPPLASAAAPPVGSAAPEATWPDPESSWPYPQTNRPEPEPSRRYVQASRPEPSLPYPQTNRPVPEPSWPYPQTDQPAPEAGRSDAPAYWPAPLASTTAPVAGPAPPPLAAPAPLGRTTGHGALATGETPGIAERAAIGDELRIPIAWCEMDSCIRHFGHPEALGEADIRARAIADGWRVDAVGRLACPQCQQGPWFWATHRVALWDRNTAVARATLLTVAARQNAAAGTGRAAAPGPAGEAEPLPAVEQALVPLPAPGRHREYLDQPGRVR